MAREVAIGRQSFSDLREGNYYYVDKTPFVKEWWKGGDDVTLICRPRRFGKTLLLSMVECFLSQEYAGRGEELFGDLSVWGDADMRGLQGSMPVVSLSFAKIKGEDVADALSKIKRVLRIAVEAHGYLLQSEHVTAGNRAFLERVADDMPNDVATDCLGELCSMLQAHWGTRPVVLLDEYDTPLQEAWLRGYWDEMSSFVRSLFNATFKTNRALGRGLITGITRVSQESIFSDMNNPAVITTTTNQYEAACGFTTDEVVAALGEFGFLDEREDVRRWYDGFTFGEMSGIYNPWSITSYLQWRALRAYWANSSSNALVSTLVREGPPSLKEDFETLLSGGSVTKVVNESVHFRQLHRNQRAVWALLLATGYLHVESYGEALDELVLSLTNHEVRTCFDSMVGDWFSDGGDSYGDFVRALLQGDRWAMTDYLGDLALAVMSSFDTGTRPSRRLPELFWHGLILGLLVDLRGRYVVRSNPESGFGRSDVVLTPLGEQDPAIVLEFKVFDRRRGEESLEDTVAGALAQIADKAYDAELLERGIDKSRIHHYGIAFDGKDVLVG